MTPAAQRCVGRQIATGMTYLHSLGIVHSDLKAGRCRLTLSNPR
jgi:serine/threonine protein kinase